MRKVRCVDCHYACHGCGYDDMEVILPQSMRSVIRSDDLAFVDNVFQTEEPKFICGKFPWFALDRANPERFYDWLMWKHRCQGFQLYDPSLTIQQIDLTPENRSR